MNVKKHSLTAEIDRDLGVLVVLKNSFLLQLGLQNIGKAQGKRLLLAFQHCASVNPKHLTANCRSDRDLSSCPHPVIRKIARLTALQRNNGITKCLEHKHEGSSEEQSDCRTRRGLLQPSRLRLVNVKLVTNPNRKQLRAQLKRNHASEQLNLVSLMIHTRNADKKLHTRRVSSMQLTSVAGFCGLMSLIHRQGKEDQQEH